MKRLALIVLTVIVFIADIGIGLVYAKEQPQIQGLPEVTVGQPYLEGLSRRVSLDLRGMDIVETIKFLSMKGNLNIVTSKDVKGRITLFLNNVTIADVLDVILLTNKLACEIKKNIITIMTEAEYEALYGKKYTDKRELKTITLKYASANRVGALLSNIKSTIGKVIMDEETGTIILIDTPEKIKEMVEAAMGIDLPTINRIIPTVTEVFELEYAKAKDIEPEISKALTKDVGTIRVDERTNKLVVTDLPHNMKIIKDLITAFDVRTRQVFIEAKIIEITLTDEFHMGVDWESILSRAHNVTIEGTFPFGYTGASSLAITVGTLDANDYEVALELIKSVGRIRIVSSPHIAVCNNEEAKFMVGSREPYVTSTITTGEVTTTTSEAVEFIEVGVTLYVTPTINKGGFVKMHIKPEISSLREWFKTAEGNQIPIVETSNVETDVLIKDGRTIIIAGLIKETESENVAKVPLLGDIPLVKNLFRNISEEKKQKELAIFLTPHIISGEADSGAEVHKKVEPKKEEKPVERKDTFYYYGRGVSNEQAGNYQQAIKEYEQALSIAPKNAIVHLRLANIYSHYIKDFEKAKYHFRQYAILTTLKKAEEHSEKGP